MKLCPAVSFSGSSLGSNSWSSRRRDIRNASSTPSDSIFTSTALHAFPINPLMSSTETYIPSMSKVCPSSCHCILSGPISLDVTKSPSLNYMWIVLNLQNMWLWWFTSCESHVQLFSRLSTVQENYQYLTLVALQCLVHRFFDLSTSTKLPTHSANYD
jgi:hypothetical protein